MAPKTQRQLAVLGALTVVLSAVIWIMYGAKPAGTAVAASKERSAKRGQTAGGARSTAPDVHLEMLEAERIKPDDGPRNPFRFKPKPPPPSPVSTTPRPVVAAAPAPSGPPPPAPPPPITLKFIGKMEPRGQGRIAFLADGQGHTFAGREGDAIEGRYRILRIGVESIEMAYLDGRGRQTIRLSGQ